MPGQTPVPDAQRPSETTTPTNKPVIDREVLAEKVYRLLLADLRLERARGIDPAKAGRKRVP